MSRDRLRGQTGDFAVRGLAAARGTLLTSRECGASAWLCAGQWGRFEKVETELSAAGIGRRCFARVGASPNAEERSTNACAWRCGGWSLN